MTLPPTRPQRTLAAPMTKTLPHLKEPVNVKGSTGAFQILCRRTSVPTTA